MKKFANQLSQLEVDIMLKLVHLLSQEGIITGQEGQEFRELVRRGESRNVRVIV